ncbi:MAG TPA: hypothetical protein VFK05_29340 [Polyangiaceae bacterium]|nr:hypothetical protein [Polyangiaceae bacterium]
MQINIGDHSSSAEGYLPVPAHLREQLYWARTKARNIAATHPDANKYFLQLRKRRSLTDLLADRTIWVNYSVLLGKDYGETTDYNEIAIAPIAFRIGRWTVLATVIHELAHCNGAAGRRSSEAELAVLACGLGRKSEQVLGDDPYTPYNPNTRG